MQNYLENIFTNYIWFLNTIFLIVNNIHNNSFQLVKVQFHLQLQHRSYYQHFLILYLFHLLNNHLYIHHNNFSINSNNNSNSNLYYRLPLHNHHHLLCQYNQIHHCLFHLLRIHNYYLIYPNRFNCNPFKHHNLINCNLLLFLCILILNLLPI